MAFNFIEKHTPHFSSLVSLLFSTNNVCKNAMFFLAASFPNKAFVFPNNRISEAHICHQGWFRKTCTIACVISRKRKTKQQGQCFPVKSKVTCKNWAHLGQKKKTPKKSLILLMHASLQLANNLIIQIQRCQMLTSYFQLKLTHLLLLMQIPLP